MRDLAASSLSSSPDGAGSGSSRKRSLQATTTTSASNNNNSSSKRQRRSLRSNSSSSSGSGEEESNRDNNKDENNGEMIVEQHPDDQQHQEAADAEPAFVECLRRIILSDDPAEVERAWSSLEDMENLESGSKNSTYDCNRSYDKFLRSILTENRIRNIAEVPKLLEWFSKFPFPNAVTNPISNDIACFLVNSAKDFKEQPYLAEIIQVLNDNHETYLPAHCDHSSLWKAVVEVLSWMKVPEDVSEVKKHSRDLITISEFLKKRNSEVQDNTSIPILCFNKLSEILLKSERREEPSSALLIVLQLVEEKLWREHMDVLIKHIMDENIDERKVVSMLSLFCHWLVQPPYMNMKYLSSWLTLFVKSLLKFNKRRIVLEVAEQVLPNIFSKCTRLPQFYSIVKDDNIVFFLFGLVCSQNLHHKMMRLIANFLEDDKIPSVQNEQEVRECIVLISVKLLNTFRAHLDNPTTSCPICERVQRSVCANLQGKNLGQAYVTEEREEAETSYPSTSSGSGRMDTGKTGLRNLGNTCYMNSVLQALAMTRAFTHEVLLYKSTDLSGQTILKHLQNLFALLKYSEKNSLAPTEIWRSSKPSYFMPGQQQDSSEFLCHLLDVLYEQEKSALVKAGSSEQSINGVESKGSEEKEAMEVEEDEAPTAGTSDSPVISEDADAPKTMARWTTEENLSEGVSLERKTQSLADFTKGEELSQTQNGLSDSHSDSTDSGIQSVGGEETSPASPYLVHRVFGGELKVTYQCMQCGTESHNTDQFRDLQLCFLDTLAPSHPITVQDLINSNYSMPEDLDGENKYRCDSCASLCNAQRIIKILQAPAHLILTLKHFRYDSESRLRTKLRRKVIYDETIKLPVLDQDNETYQLYAAVVHSGYSMDYGHYITYACDAKNRWYKFNDNFVSQTTLEDFKRLEPPDTPYILFYRRCGRQDEPDEDAPDFGTLAKSLQDFVEHDKRCQTEERRTTRLSAAGNSISRYNPNGYWNNDDDEDNPPPRQCRDAVNIPSGKFLC